MLDLKLIRSDPERVQRELARRGSDADIAAYLALDERRRKLLAEVETLKAERNRASEGIARAKQAKADASEAIAAMQEVGARIKALDEQVREVETDLEAQALRFPNLPDPSVPDGVSDAQNVIMREWGEPRAFDFEPQPHWDIAARLGIIDFERAAKIAGTRFEIFRGAGALLRRALMNFMLETHVTERGYIEIAPPILTSRESLTASGHLPLFDDDLFHVRERDQFLIPTAESPLANLHRDEILEDADLPRRYAAFSPCFRNEKVGAGKESRGLIRQYQFDKIELFWYTRPEKALDELETLTADAERIYQLLKLPYKIELHCAGDMAPAAVKAYDPLAWFPGVGKWLELSSCSCCGDWQARRANVRFRREPRGKPEFVHTLNGSGLAIGRTLAAVLENYQQADGTVRIPDALVPYMRGMTVIG
jgi:seryl-tRNA synthetase